MQSYQREERVVFTFNASPRCHMPSSDILLLLKLKRKTKRKKRKEEKKERANLTSLVRDDEDNKESP